MPLMTDKSYINVIFSNILPKINKMSQFHDEYADDLYNHQESITPINTTTMKQTAVEWLIVQIKNDHIDKALKGWEWLKIFEQAKEMEKQMVIDIVEKSRATGLTAEYLIEQLKQQQ